MMRLLAVAAALSLSACASQLPEMSEDEARATLERFAADDPEVGHICDPESGALFRHAVRSYASAKAAKGEQWPNPERAFSSPSVRNLDGYVVMMSAFGFTSDGQFGRGLLRAHSVAAAALPRSTNMANEPQCRAMYGSMRGLWDGMSELQELSQQMERAQERGDDAKVRRLQERIERITERMQASQEAFIGAVR